MKYIEMPGIEKFVLIMGDGYNSLYHYGGNSRGN